MRQSERYICTVCRRVHARPTPNGACTKMHCAGTVEASPPPTDDYNVSLLTRPFAMVTAEEHTAQVPAERARYEIEKEFKRRGGTVNTLVASPTLELGVDIGALDLVLCRNVPPTPANYWQRVGRAGRRRRMAVVYVYCRRAVHDAYFFDQPEKLLGAPLRPPRFNLKNDVLVRKHVHAAVLSELLRLAKNDEPTSEALDERSSRSTCASTCSRVRTIATAPRQPTFGAPLGGLIDANRQLLVDAVKRVFAAGWPSEAAAEVAPEQLEGLVLAMPGDLQGLRRPSAPAADVGRSRPRPPQRDRERAAAHEGRGTPAQPMRRLSARAQGAPGPHLHAERARRRGVSARLRPLRRRHQRLPGLAGRRGLVRALATAGDRRAGVRARATCSTRTAAATARRATTSRSPGRSS